jgi:hypothetical protein
MRFNCRRPSQARDCALCRCTSNESNCDGFIETRAWSEREDRHQHDKQYRACPRRDEPPRCRPCTAPERYRGNEAEPASDNPYEGRRRDRIRVAAKERVTADEREPGDREESYGDRDARIEKSFPIELHVAA